MRRPVQWLLIVCAFGGLVWIAVRFQGWTHWQLKPTYPTERVVASLKRMCLRDYHLSVEAHRQGETLQVFFWKIGLLRPKSFEIQSEAAESLERVLLCATRVALSTDAPLKFIEIKMADVLTGATVTLWRYVPDIRDSMFTRFSEEEYSNRLVMEMSTETEPEGMGPVHSWDPPLTLAEFLAKQIISRTKRQSPVVLRVHADLSRPATLGVVVDNWSAIEKKSPREKTRITEVVEKSARAVLQGYQFSGFQGVVLKDGRGVPLRRWTF